MENNRFNEIINLTRENISALMMKYNSQIEVIGFSQMHESLSNTAYKVITTDGTFLLKLYSSSRDKIECAMYQYLEDKIKIPKLYYYDNKKRFHPFSYAIFEFIEGVTLAEYLRQTKYFSTKMAFEIGCICSTIQKRTYSHNAGLNGKLHASKRTSFFCEKLKKLINDIPSTYLKTETVMELLNFVNKKNTVFDRINAETVLSHGDFNFWNLMVSNEKIYCIDFEYACADSRYRDIGNFFRRKDSSIETLMSDKVYQAFEEGYNSVSETKLPSDWLRIARCCDIVTMLGPMLNEHFPIEWVHDIEENIMSTICK